MWGRLAKAGLFLSVLVTITVVLDGLLWLLAPVPVDPAVHHVHSQNIPGLEPLVVYSENDFGLRSESMETREKPEGVIRILAIGASTTQQTTQNLEDTWPNALERGLNEALAGTGSRVEVAAYGRGGLRAIDLYRWARSELPGYDADIVVTLLGVNDLTFTGGPEYAYEGVAQLIQDEPPPADASAEPASPMDHCLRVSQFCRRARFALGRLRNLAAVARGQAVEWHSTELIRQQRQLLEYPYIDAPVRPTDPILEFGDAMELLLGYLKEQGVKPVVLGQPVLWKEEMSDEERASLWFFVNTPEGRVRASTPWLLSQMQRYNEVQAEVARSRGVPYVDLDAVLEKSRDNYFDDCHYTDRGSLRLAEAALPTLEIEVREVLRTGGG